MKSGGFGDLCGSWLNLQFILEGYPHQYGDNVLAYPLQKSCSTCPAWALTARCFVTLCKVLWSVSDQANLNRESNPCFIFLVTQAQEHGCLGGVSSAGSSLKLTAGDVGFYKQIFQMLVIRLA